MVVRRHSKKKYQQTKISTMALLKVFVSSTCYDLGMVRGELRTFISNLGHDPIMSDYNDVLFDPRSHTHESCIKEIPNSDVVILIIGSRHGGTAIPKAINSLDIEKLKSFSKSNKMLDTPESISITQLEILKAIEVNIPIFTFVDSRVLHDHLFYEKNKDKGILDSIEFPSVDKKETAVYIFEFINFLRLRSKNNSIVEFSKISDIEDFLKKQWSGLLQRLLFEQRTQKGELRKMEMFSEELKDIKSLILTSISSTQTKEIGRGVLKFRRVIEFLLEFQHNDVKALLYQNIEWDLLLKELSIRNVVISENVNRYRPVVFLVREDDSFYESRFPVNMISKMANEWNTFRQLSDEVRIEIVNAIADNDSHTISGGLRFRAMPFDEYIESLNEAQNNITTTTTINPSTLDDNNGNDDESNE